MDRSGVADADDGAADDRSGGSIGAGASGAARYDAVLVVSFGGPEGPEDVDPFLHRVLRGRDVPPQRLAEVAQHYHLFGGISPINGHNRALVAALGPVLARSGTPLPVYWGNRNWAPLLADEVRRMRDDGIRRALAFVTSAYSSYSGCRQYLDDIQAARAEVGGDAPEIDKLRPFYNHPTFIEIWVGALRDALARSGDEATVLFTAHSIPETMASTSDYQRQLTETARLVATGAGVRDGRWQLVWQSRSGPPAQRWLEPDVVDAIGELPAGARAVVLAPIGFVSDHMEVVYDLDTVAAEAGRARGLHVERVVTPGTTPAFVAMIAELVAERLDPATERRTTGRFGPAPDWCAEGCCPAPARRN